MFLGPPLSIIFIKLLKLVHLCANMEEISVQKGGNYAAVRKDLEKRPHIGK